MTERLDVPIWSALTTRQQAVALGDGLARRFDPAYGPFPATKDDSPASVEVPFLHVVADNDAAQRTYQRVGFMVRRALRLTAVQRRSARIDDDDQ